MTVRTTIRTARPADAPRIAALLDQLGHPAEPAEAETRLATWDEDPHSALLVAVVDGTVAGAAPRGSPKGFRSRRVLGRIAEPRDGIVRTRDRTP